MNKEEVNNREKLTKDFPRIWGKIDNRISNTHLKNRNQTELWEWTHRVRTQSLNVGTRGFLLGGMKEQNRAKTFYELAFVSPKCEGCDELCDYWHLWTCPKLEKLREEAENKIDDILRKYRKEETRYWVTEKDKTDLQVPITPPAQPS
jgi:hypothetical protein